MARTFTTHVSSCGLGADDRLRRRVRRAELQAEGARWFHGRTCRRCAAGEVSDLRRLRRAGRLYVCESSGTAEWNKPQPKETPHRVLRLDDADGDGVFDRRTVFAEFEQMAQGSMWLDGSLYVAAAPVIWKLTDTNDDGVADRPRRMDQDRGRHRLPERLARAVSRARRLHLLLQRSGDADVHPRRQAVDEFGPAHSCDGIRGAATWTC